MKIFAKSLKDIISLFKIAEKEELKLLLVEYRKKVTEEGEEAAVGWFEEQ